MQPTLADVAAAIDEDPHPGCRAVLDELANTLLRIGVVRREIEQLGTLQLRLTLDARAGGGDDDRRDAAAA